MRFQTDPGSARDADRDAERDPLDTRPDETDRHRTDDAAGEEIAANETDVVPADAGDTSTSDRDRDGVPDEDEDEDEADAAAGPVDRDGDGVPDDRVVEPAPVPTAFGASTVGGAVAASALAGRDRAEDRDADRADEGVDAQQDRLDEDRVDDDRADDHAIGVAAPPPGAAVDPGTAGAPVGATVPVAAGIPEGGRAVPVEEESGTVRVQAGDRDGDGTPDADDRDDGDDLVAWPPEPAMEPAGPAAAAAPASLWEEGATAGLRERWREVQLRFVDDPRGAADEAQSLVGEAIDTLTAALAERRSELDGWRTGDGGTSQEDTETERLRVAVRGYRDFLDRLLGL